MIMAGSHRLRFLATASVVAALALAGCGRKDAEKAETAAPTAADAKAELAAGGSPLRFAEASEHSEVELVLPPEVKSQAELHAQLYAQGVRDLRAFAEGAVADRTDMELEGPPPPPYTRRIVWRTQVETPKLLSLQRVDHEFAGGAHPNVVESALLWDKALKRAVSPMALFRRDTDFAKLDAVLCERIRLARANRLGVDAAPEADGWTCPKWRESAFVLAPSTIDGKAGGLLFLFSPYAVGPYSEGAYGVLVPLEVFARNLSSGYADEFGGDVLKSGPS